MKPDPEYTRKILTAFEDAPNPTTDIYELHDRGIEWDSEEFVFHAQLLEDNGYIQREDGKRGLGIDRSADGQYSFSVVPLRLTASGHEFAEAMESEGGFQAVKKSLIKSSLSIMRDIAVGGLKSELTKHGLLP